MGPAPWWIKLLAYFRISPSAVCWASEGATDYHDYPDSAEKVPWHLATMTCERCGKEFTI